MFRNYIESGTPLLTDSAAKCTATFLLEKTNTTIANTLRRCILTETRSVGFRADLTNQDNPGIKINKNTGVIFNEMLAHRLTLIPLGVREIDSFDPTRYECVLRVRNDGKSYGADVQLQHVRADSFLIRERQADGSMLDLGPDATSAMFPPDPITKETCLITTLRGQWNPEKPPEEVDLIAYPVISTGREYMGFCPVSQCSFANTPDDDPARQEEFFKAWVSEYKKGSDGKPLTDMSAIPPEMQAQFRKEWETMSIQRCFLVDETGQPNSFTFTIESVGIRPVQEIVSEGIQAVINLLAPYTDSSKPAADLGISTQPVDSRMNGIDVLFDGQEHTLGNLLQHIITELYLDAGASDSPIVYVGYKVRHPLHRVMTLRFELREGVTGDPVVITRQIISEAAQRAQAIFEELGRSWSALIGGVTGAGGEATAPELEG